jgi:hypothetical protein
MTTELTEPKKTGAANNRGNSKQDYATPSLEVEMRRLNAMVVGL